MSEDKFDLSDKVAIVTGASRGLGKATSVGLAESGADIVAVDVLDLRETIEKVEDTGRSCLGVEADVRNKGEVFSMVNDALEEFGGIDILVNNAGINIIEPTDEMSEETWDRVMDVNLKGAFFCCQAVGKYMKKGKDGKIVNVSSINAEFAFPYSAAYNASKAGMVMLTRTLAYEWGKYNINVNAVCPGFMQTSMLDEIHEVADLTEERIEKVPLGKFARPEDIVGTIVYLSSEASDYVTGHSLFVDGGWTVGWPGVKEVSLDPGLREALDIRDSDRG
ncbi:MAG: SDR family NAD(P)-dependent oxidoreductase [Candidatus Hadarchaeota archaeon]